MGYSAIIYRSSMIDMDNFVGNDFDMTSRVKMKIDNSLVGSENSKWHITERSIYQITGKEYLGTLDRYVVYDTSYDMSKTPFVFGSNGTILSGEAHYIAANNGKIVIKANCSSCAVYEIA